MRYQQPRVVPVESGSGSVAPPPELPEKACEHLRFTRVSYGLSFLACVSESVGSSRKYPKTTAVPNSQFVIDLGKVASGADPRTTCMIRNIPNKYTQKMLLKLFDSVIEECRVGGFPRVGSYSESYGVPASALGEKGIFAYQVPSICGQYDFFYLPMDFRNKCNVGYAFIDFSNPRTSKT